ncbi:MAG TPA: hypothetical protein VMV69_08770 [Pirellulales bacterium]|nr:hypothetical protein [Pirellulales bacterium]
MTSRYQTDKALSAAQGRQDARARRKDAKRPLLALMTDDKADAASDKANVAGRTTA